MNFAQLKEMLQDALCSVKSMIDVDCVVGAPVVTAEATVIPVSKLSYGFVTGGLDLKQQGAKADQVIERPIGTVGGGISVVPVGFLISDASGTSFIKSQGDYGDKWLEIIDFAVKNALKKS